MWYTVSSGQMRATCDFSKMAAGWIFFKSEVVSYHTGGDESSSISHAILRFVYCLGQRYNVEMVHALVARYVCLSLCSTEECFLSEIALVINKPGSLLTWRVIRIKIPSLLGWQTVVYPQAWTWGVRCCFMAQPARPSLWDVWWRGWIIQTVLWTQWFVLSCLLYDGNSGVKERFS